jgi:hypothetical protein
LTRPSHNVYSKIVKPWLDEGSVPRALRCVSQTNFLNSIAETEFREQGKASTQHKGQLGKRPSHNTTVRERRKGMGHVTEDITKNFTRKKGHGYCETAE